MTIVDHLRRTVLLQDGAGLSDGQLLESFLARRDEAAFEALVRRHAPMVWGVCRRLLGNPHDSEDAFQATFLVLVYKASSIRPREAVGPWLYGVAYRTALKARAMAAKRRKKERATHVVGAAKTDDDWAELLPHLDREINRLPEKYRVPIVLCDLQGRSRKEVARLLKLPEGTLSSRLATARKLLAKRLARYGPAVSGGALATMLAQEAASACVPCRVMLAAAKLTTAGLVAAPVATLTQGVLKVMFLSKLHVLTAVLVTLFLLAGGVVVLTHPGLAGEQGPSEKPAAKRHAAKESATPTLLLKDLVLEAVDVTHQTVTVTSGKSTVSHTLLRHAARTAVEGSDEQYIRRVTLDIRGTLPTVTEVKVFLEDKSPDKRRKLLNSLLEKSDRKLATDALVHHVWGQLLGPQETRLQGLSVAKGTEVLIDEARAELSDLKVGMTLQVSLGVEEGRLVVKAIRATK